MKKKSSKIRILTVIAALLLLLCTACGGADGSANNTPSGPADNSAADPQPAGTTVENISDYAARDNNLEFINSYSSEAGKPLIISGLKDTAVQQKINNAIKTEMERVADPSFVPPGRGVRMYEKQAVKKPTSYYYMVQYANCDNILSVALRYSRVYDLGSNRSVQLQYVSPLNFDLATGEQLTLKDLFPDGTDYMQYLNSRMLDMIQRSDPSREPSQYDWNYYYAVQDAVPPLISEFKGFREDQPFFLVDKGQLELVLDPGNPEFYLMSGTEIVRMDISEVYYAGVRFGGDRGLYQDNTERYHLVQMEIPGGTIVENKTLEDILGFKSSIFSGSVSTSRYAKLTEKQNDFLSLKEMDLDQMVKDGIAEVEEFRKTHNNYGIKYLNISSSANRVGGLVNLNASYYSNIYAANRDYNNVSKVWARCCRFGSDEVLSLEDIFADGADWKSLIKRAIIQNAEDSLLQEEGGPDPHGQLFSDYLDELLDSVEGFNVTQNSLSLWYSQDRAADIFKDYYYNGWSDFITRNVLYESIGYGNLKLFSRDFWSK